MPEIDRRLVILVEFELRVETRAEFHRLVLANASASLATEPGCRQFDVVIPEGNPGDRVLLYEIYDDAAAFEAHLRTTHFAEFAAVAEPLAMRKTVTRLGFAQAA